MLIGRAADGVQSRIIELLLDRSGQASTFEIVLIKFAIFHVCLKVSSDKSLMKQFNYNFLLYLPVSYFIV